eukprot:5734404-Amphidinium_carterae.1
MAPAATTLPAWGHCSCTRALLQVHARPAIIPGQEVCTRGGALTTILFYNASLSVPSKLRALPGKHGQMHSVDCMVKQ